MTFEVPVFLSILLFTALMVDSLSESVEAINEFFLPVHKSKGYLLLSSYKLFLRNAGSITYQLIDEIVRHLFRNVLFAMNYGLYAVQYSCYVSTFVEIKPAMPKC